MGCSNNFGKYRSREENSNAIFPGPCDPELGCPPPTEIVCIKTEKVYESCRKVQVNTEVTNLSGIAVGEITEAFCRNVELVVDDKHPFVCQKIQGTNRARVSFFFRYRFEYIDQEGVKWFCSDPVFHQTTVIMSPRIQEDGLFVQCEVFLECLECFPPDPRRSPAVSESCWFSSWWPRFSCSFPPTGSVPNRLCAHRWRQNVPSLIPSGLLSHPRKTSRDSAVGVMMTGARHRFFFAIFPYKYQGDL